MGDFLDDKTEHTHVRGPPSSRAGNFRKEKRVKSSDGSPWLDDVTLGELDPEQSPQKSWRQKAAWIQTWAKRAPWDAMEEIHLVVVLVPFGFSLRGYVLRFLDLNECRYPEPID